MNAVLRNALAVAGLAIATHAMADVTFYEYPNFEGRSFTTQRQIGNLERWGFNDRASSVVVRGERWERWEVCEDPRFDGRCVVLRRGQYPSLEAMGLSDGVASVRVVPRNARYDDDRYAPQPMVDNDYRPRSNERLYQANITSVRAVVATPERRCWIEREEVSQERSSANVPGALVGAVIGGILGHQVGGGSGRDIATAGGVVAGAAIGSNAGRDRNARQPVMQDVQRCETAPAQARPAYWDVTYHFRGQEHRVQMTTPPGATVTVNRNGEPRAAS